jgi:ubiquinone/menaquinone biosynthesis C-methylase UbiE/4-amino-4-deoxy-L-arabinose transferase-like glycosyltransferase
LLWQQLKTLPAFRALLRAVEARFYHKVDLPQPVLDIGCGDGHFTKMAFDHPIQVGIDPWWGPLNKAVKSGSYALPLQAMGDDLPFPDNCFSSAFSNSVLEHIPDIQPVLDEIGRVLQSDAPFVITVPSHYFTEYLGGAEFFTRLGLEGMAGSYRNLFNRISRHAHTDPPEVWAERLTLAGFQIERWQYYFSREALHTLELGHAQGVPSAVMHALTGHWIIGPWESNLKWTERWVRPYYEEEFPAEGAYIFFLARKTTNASLSLSLPPAQPFSLQELDESTGRSSPELVLAAPLQSDQAENDERERSVGDAAQTQQDEPSASVNWRPIAAGALGALILLFAYWGQSSLRANPELPGTGIGWFALSSLSFLLLLWKRGSSKKSSLPSLRLPDFRQIPQRRWLYVLALFLALLAPRFVSTGGSQHPLIAIVIWLAAIIIAYFAFFQPRSTGSANTYRISHFTLIASVLLFLAALLVRLYDLEQHPFILNGTEASIGLDAMNVVNGSIRNPFSTGWLTNPTLPLYLLAIPLKVLGPSVLALRLLSPFIGALTVVATFLIGQRLFGRAVGLAAAVLLLGSHFHIHFSRLGLTNVWDALLVLLSLGFIAIAWQQEPEQNRPAWLLAGLALGFSAYLYTSSHLLPLMLLSLLVLTLIFERQTWKKQWRNVIAMGSLAFVIALPQLLAYRANPGIFMERAAILGILDNQGGWLNQEAVRTGASQLQLLSKQVWAAALAFNATLDTGTSYGPFVPLLNFMAGMLAILGSVLAFIRSRQLRYSMLIVWVTITIIFAGALLENAPNSHRYIIAAPAVSLLAAIALIELVAALLPRSEEDQPEEDQQVLWYKRKALLLIIPLLIAAAMAIYDMGYYFGPYRNEHHFGDRNTEIADAMATYLNSLEGDWSAYFYGPPSMYVDFPTIPFLASTFQKDVNLFDIAEPDAELPLTDSPNHVFIYLPERYDELSIAKFEYPSGREQIIDGYYATPLFHVYEIRDGT